MSDMTLTHSSSTPAEAMSPTSCRRWLLPLALVLLCGVLYLWRLGSLPLEDFDETYYAAGAREMLEQGDLGTPYYNGQPFLLKPILIYWMIALAFHFLGPTEFAARVGSAFLGVGIVLLTYWFTTRTVNRRAGFIAGLALALNYMWIDITRDASIDVPLTAALTGALFLCYLAPHAAPEKRRWWYLAAYPLLGVALLAKGPAPTGVVVVGYMAYLIAARRLMATRIEAQLFPGILLMLAVAVPWYAYEMQAQPKFFETFIIGEHFGHIQGQLARTEPVWGNLRYLLIYFLPWAAFLPAALLHAFRQQEKTHVLRFAAWWVIAVVVLFSIPQSKLAHYLAPAFPPLAILIGGWFDAWQRRLTKERASVIFAFTLFALLGVACLAAMLLALLQPPPIDTLLENNLAQYDSWLPGPSPLVILAILGMGFLITAVTAHRRTATVPVLAGTMVLAAVVFIGWFKPHWAMIQSQPRKELSLYAARTLPTTEPLGVFYIKYNATIFYFPRPIEILGETAPQRLAEFLRKPYPVAALTHVKVLPKLHELGVTCHIQQQRGAYVLIQNDAPK